MKTNGLSLLLLALIAASSTTIQSQTATTPVHHSLPATHRSEAGGCAKLPEISPKIPALPAGLACAKVLYTLTRSSEVKLDYVSPLVSPTTRAELSPGVSTFSLDYVDTRVGTGDLAQPHKWYTVNYTGYLLDGTKFDSSLDRNEPISFPYGQHRVIAGWDTAFEGMRTGGKRRLFVPYQLAYGETGRPPVIPAKSELIFDVEFISQSDTQPKPAVHAAPKPPATAPLTSTPPASAPPASTPPASTPPASTPPASTPNSTPSTPKE